MDTKTLEKSFAIHHDLLIQAPAQEVFAAVSDPGHLENWWPLRCAGEPRLGGEYNFYFSPEYDWRGEVAAYEPGSSFHVKMTQADADWTPTSFGFDLEEAESGVLLRFWHKGWPECNAHYRRSSFCWAMLLNGLKNYVEKGIVVPFSERE